MRAPQRATLSLSPSTSSPPFSCSCIRTPRTSHQLLPHQQVRHATLIRRPKRPYTFTQLMTLSDGSTYLHRTTSPTPLHRSTRDTRNTPLWNPSNARLANVEEDQAGRLRAFRRRFGRAFDSSLDEDGEMKSAGASGGGEKETVDVSQAERKARADIATATAAEVGDGAPSTAPPPSAAAKMQEEASLHGQGLGTTTSSSWDMDIEQSNAANEDSDANENENESRRKVSDDDDDQDNLIDLISSYSGGEAEKLPGGAGARVVTRGTSGVAGDGGRGKKKKGGKKK